MIELRKPSRMSYSGEEGQVTAYADVCEMAWMASLCMGGMGVALRAILG